jgi:cytochrome P450
LGRDVRTIAPRELLTALVPLVRDPASALFDMASGADQLTDIQTPTFRFVQVNDPAIARQLLTRHNESLAKGPFFARSRDLLGDGILTSDEPLHSARRREMLPFFSGSRMEGYSRALDVLVDDFVSDWLASDEIDVGEQLRELTLAAVLTCFFGSPATPGAPDFLSVFAAELDSYTASRLLTYAALVSPRPNESRNWNVLDRAAHAAIRAILQAYALSNRVQDGARERMRQYPDALISDRLEQLEDESRDDAVAPSGDLLSALCDLMRVTPAPDWSRSAVRDELLTILLAGHETTASSLTWSLGLVGASEGGYLRDERAIDQVIYETLRLYPPAWVIPRVVTQPFVIAGTELDAGTQLIISPYLYHRQSAFDRPDEFIPDRWTDEMIASPPAAFMPFGVGDRACIGQRFAWLEMRTVLRTILRRSKLSLSSPLPDPEFLFTLRPAGSIRLRVRAASSSSGSTHT